MSDVRARFLRVLDWGVDRGALTRDEAMMLLATVDAADQMREQNIRVLNHEMNTPMRGHDPDGTCCRAAILGDTPTTTPPPDGANRNDLV